MHPNEHTNNTLKARELSTPDDTYTTEETINQLKALTEKLCLVKDRITIDHAIIEIRSAANEMVDDLSGWVAGVEADNDTLRKEIARLKEERDDAKDKPLALTPHPICTAPRDGTPILVWDGEWNAWVAARWLIVCGINKGLDSGGWYGDHDCSWRANCLDVRTPQWWLPMPHDPTKNSTARP
jgi:hypothetical protein